MISYALFYGRKRKAFAHVHPDATYPAMWRIHWPDGDVSDMVNLPRAKDAARLLARQRAPHLIDPRLWRWKAHKNAATAAPMRFSGEPLSDIGSNSDASTRRKRPWA